MQRQQDKVQQALARQQQSSRSSGGRKSLWLIPRFFWILSLLTTCSIHWLYTKPGRVNVMLTVGFWIPRVIILSRFCNYFWQSLLARRQNASSLALQRWPSIWNRKLRQWARAVSGSNTHVEWAKGSYVLATLELILCQCKWRVRCGEKEEPSAEC